MGQDKPSHDQRMTWRTGLVALCLVTRSFTNLA
jgi:hypothetical protein